MKGYNVEEYWNKVAGRISMRPEESILAGDDEPFYSYKRQVFLKWFDVIEIEDKSILEVGVGPGGNLFFLKEKGAKDLSGVDISENMIELAKGNKKLGGIDLIKTDGHVLPFQEKSKHIVFTSTVLQHNTDDIKMKNALAEMCRVSSHDVYLFERTNRTIFRSETNVGRTVSQYVEVCAAMGFKKQEVKFLRISLSYILCGGLRKLSNLISPKEEGEKPSNFVVFTQKLILPITSLIDPLIPSRSGLTLIHMTRN